jgi:AraC-like DNA-binding protein
VRYREQPPATDLRATVECFWSLALDAPAQAAPQCIFPDGRIELVLHLGTPFERLLEDGRGEPQSRWLVVGQMTRATYLRPTGATLALGVRFRPGGASRVFAAPLAELRDRIVPLEATDLRRPVPRAALEDAPSHAARIALLEAWLRRCLDAVDAAPDALMHVVNAALRAPGSFHLGRLAAATGLAPRQLERGFARHVGLPPKLFLRIQRFQSVFAAVSGQRPALTGLALDCGYADQAHFNREFREFSGTTPGAYFGSERGLAALFTRAPGRR